MTEPSPSPPGPNPRVTPGPEEEGTSLAERPSASGWAGWTLRHRWPVFILPLAVYLVAGVLEHYLDYPVAYLVRVLLTLLAMLAVQAGYRQFAFRVSWLAIILGLAGGPLWISLCRLKIEQKLLDPLGWGLFLGLGERAAYNPWSALASTPGLLAAFLSLRFLGLVLVVPIIEEFFLRGFLMRYVLHERWWKVPCGHITGASILSVVVYVALSHPAELVTATVWFLLITWLLYRTRNLWDCVAAHALTNLILGLYVVTWGHWDLW